MVSLPIVEIPGYSDAVKRESRVRDSAFVSGMEEVCGVCVNPLSLSTLILLEQARNGLVVPCVFFNTEEAAAHAIQVLYFCSPQFEIPTIPQFSFWRALRESIKEAKFIRSIRRRFTHEQILTEVRDWIAEAMMDAPPPSGDVVVHPGYASYPAHIVDHFAEAGYHFTKKEIMEMALKELWQYWRISKRRKYGTPLSNPSDELACDFLGNKK